MEHLEQWRAFFESSGADLMTIIDRAITVASMDKPRDLLLRREGFAEKLFASSLRASSELSELENGGSDGRNSAVVQVKDEGNCGSPEMNDPAGAYSYAEAEALSDEMEEESRQLKEIFRIKDRLMNYDECDEEEIFEELQTLESMDISFQALKETEIGKQVNKYKKHYSKRVHSTARRLVRLWKVVVDEWCQSLGDLTAVSLPESNEEDHVEYGLPSPPLDEGALLATRTTSLEMNQLFDFIDDDLSAGSGETNSPVDDGNFCSDSSKNSQLEFQSRDTLIDHPGNQQRNVKEEFDVDKRREGIKPGESGRIDAIRKNEKDASRGAQVSSANNRKNSSSQDKVTQDSRTVTNNDSRIKPLSGPSNRVRNSDVLVRKEDTLSKQQGALSKNGITKYTGSREEISVAERLAAAKRKLQEGYQQAENAKKQRTVQVMELHDLPKNGPNRAKLLTHNKPGSQNHLRHWSANRI